MKKLLAGSVLLFSGAISPAIGAAADAKPLTMEYDATTMEVPATVLPGACPVKLMPATDGRQNKETLGANVNTPLLSGNAAAWSSSALLNLAAFGFAVADGKSANAQGVVTIVPTITRAYTWQVGLGLFGTVVMKVDYQLADGTVQHKTYRESGNKTNMWGADSEYVTTLNYALSRIVRDVAIGAQQACQNKA